MLEQKFLDWYDRIGRHLLKIGGILVAIVVAVKIHLLSLFAPFIVAWIFAMILDPFVTFLNSKLHIHRGFGTILSMVSVMSGIVAVLSYLIKKLCEQVVAFANTLPALTEQTISQINVLQAKMGKASVIIDLDNVVEQISGELGKFLATIIPGVGNVLSKVPDVVMFIVMVILATFFMTKDYYKIKEFIKAQVSDTVVDKVVVMQRGVISAIGGYVKTQLLLMCMTFMICLVGLFIIDVPYLLLLSVVIACIDALPVFGSGTILIPWSVYNMLIGNYVLAIGLLCIYGVIFIARQIMEPRILSTQIGVYALVTAMAVYIGYKVGGIFGMIGGPIIVATFNMLQSVGAIPKFKEPKEEVIINRQMRQKVKR